MKRNGRILVATLALCLAAAALGAPAGAEEEAQPETAKKATHGFTVGAGLGGATYDKFDGGSFAWRIQAAYAPCKWFGGEIEWLGLDTQEQTFEGVGRVGMNAGGFNLSAMPILPIGDDFTAFGKVGGYFWDANFRGLDGGNWSTDLSFGAGVTYNLLPSFGVGIRAEWTRLMLEIGKREFTGGGTFAAMEDDVDVFTVGAFFSY